MIDQCYVGDVRDGLRAFIAAGIGAQTCVTSPPYWGLRDYGTAKWEGGDDDCDHIGNVQPSAPPGTDKQASNRGAGSVRSGDCACGARRIDRQIGLEPTIAEYVATMVEVFRLVRDVLADDGTLWLNLGDSYATTPTGNRGSKSALNGASDATYSATLDEYVKAKQSRPPIPEGLKPKDLCGIPWRVAFALQADGWYLRSDIIWAKPNPMPESVTDRPTKSHEYLFLLAKSDRYYYDAAAIAEPASDSGGNGAFAGRQGGTRDTAISGGFGTESTHPYGNVRNRRSVWTVATAPYSDAHFATFPPALIEPCILAGSRSGDVILDPFMGSGTVAKVAQSLGRRWIGCELNPAYATMQKTRAAQLGMEL